MQKFETMADTPNEEQKLSIEKETLEAIAAGNALPTPEFLAESAEAKMALLRAFESAREFREGVQGLEPEQRDLMVTKITEALETGEVLKSTILLQALLGTVVASNTLALAEKIPEENIQNMVRLVGIVIAGVAVTRYWKMLTSDNVLSDSDRIRQYLESVITT